MLSDVTARRSVAFPAAVSPLQVHQLIRQYRRHTAALAAVVAIVGAVALAHSGMQESDMRSAVAWCVAVLPAAVAASLVLGVTLPHGRARGLDAQGPVPAGHDAPPPLPKARDGPTRLTVLRL
jgi:hypothetical protein